VTSARGKIKRWAGLGLSLYILQAAIGFAYGVYIGFQQAMGF